MSGFVCHFFSEKKLFKNMKAIRDFSIQFFFYIKIFKRKKPRKIFQYRPLYMNERELFLEECFFVKKIGFMSYI